MPDDADKKAVLRRRAFFVSSALAALGCAQKSAPAEPQRNVVTVPTASEGVGERTPDAGIATDRPPSKPRTDMPSLDVPSGVSDTAKNNYERLARVMTDTHRRLDEVDAMLAKNCAISDPQCDAHWRSMAQKLQELTGRYQDFFVCDGKSAEAKAFGERQRLHDDYYQGRRRELLKKLQAQTSTPAAAQKWQTLMAEAEQANPRPCLKFACPEW